MTAQTGHGGFTSRPEWDAPVKPVRPPLLPAPELADRPAVERAPDRTEHFMDVSDVVRAAPPRRVPGNPVVLVHDQIETRLLTIPSARRQHRGADAASRTMRIPWITSSGTAPGKSLANHATSWPRSTSAARYASVTRSAPPPWDYAGRASSTSESAWVSRFSVELPWARRIGARAGFRPSGSNASGGSAASTGRPGGGTAGSAGARPGCAVAAASNPPPHPNRRGAQIPPPDQRQSGDTFEDEQAELQWDQQKKQSARVLQQHQKAVPVGIKALGIAGAEFHRRAAAGRIDEGRATMM